LAEQELKTTKDPSKSGSVLRHTKDDYVNDSWAARKVYPMTYTGLIIEGRKEGKLLTILDTHWRGYKIPSHEEDQWEAEFRTPNDLFEIKEKNLDSLPTFTSDMLIKTRKTRVLL
jgi:hypothetical protein